MPLLQHLHFQIFKLLFLYALLKDRYHKILSFIESKLLPFQREGVRFILQHGGCVLLTDEVGLGKTLQAIHCLKLNHFHTLSVHHDAWQCFASLQANNYLCKKLNLVRISAFLSNIYCWVVNFVNYLLIIALSSLCLQWASMIQQWLNIPSSDILIYIDSIEAKIPSVLDYVGTVIEVSSVNIYYLLANDIVDDII
ncbi:SWI/SNF-related matrix-associated actin-dependent regulator of chromatin subfamily A-like protein 1 [Glycine soja]